ncbi:hypothetical protein DL93DRAFT_633218 [Clavulina sp. PMI_390]|nr:hypothetical protein DL93DRAFT_633218 [Clavulina sp. PMI_390]
MTSLKDRIAALQANSGVAQSSSGSRSPSPAPSTLSDTPSPNGSTSKGIVGGTRLKDKIARFDRAGGTPIPVRGSFGLAGATTANTGAKEMYGNVSEKPNHAHQRSASLRVPRYSDGALMTSGSEKPFETISARTRSPSGYSTLSNNSPRPSYLTPDITGESGYFPRAGSLRSVSPSAYSESSPKPSTLSPRRALTTDAISDLPSAPSFRSQDAASSIMTDGEVDSERDLLSTSPGTTANSIANTSMTNLSSSVSGPPSSFVPEAGSVRMSARPSSASTRSVDIGPSTPDDMPAAPGSRPSTPSYLAQAAAYFPPSKRQSVHLPALPLHSTNPSEVSLNGDATSPPRSVPSSYLQNSGRKSVSALDELGSDSRTAWRIYPCECQPHPRRR